MAKRRKSWITRFYDYADNQGLRRDGTVRDVARRIKKAGLAKIPEDYFEDERDLIYYLKSLNLPFNKNCGNSRNRNKNRNKSKKSGKKSDDFYNTWAWKRKRYEVLRNYGAYCMVCDRGKEDNTIICVDHIYPRSKYPELELDFDNLQVLCQDCNEGKSDTSYQDFRESARIRRERVKKGLKPWDPDPDF